MDLYVPTTSLQSVDITSFTETSDTLLDITPLGITPSNIISIALTLHLLPPQQHHSSSMTIKGKDKGDQDHRQAACNSPAAEMSDNILFKQPDSSHLGDCPICILPLSLDTSKSVMQSCCTKLICIGCYYASIKHEVETKFGKRTCPFCRQPEPNTEAEIECYKMKRMEVNDPVAILEAGKRCYHQGNYENAFHFLNKAAELGEVEAHYCLSFMYRDGNGVDRDMAKRLQHLKLAAIGGQPKARHNLGVYEMNREKIERAVMHFTIATNNGNDDSAKALMELHEAGHVSQEDYELALREYQSAVNTSNSPQREAALAAMKTLGRR